MGPKAESIEEYFSWFPIEKQEKLQQIRQTLKKVLPEAKEVISYHMPAFKTSEVLVYYAAMKNHLGFYPTASGVKAFAEELKDYPTSKGVVQLPYEGDLPLELIQKIALFRKEEAFQKVAEKAKSTKAL
ncbi:iron chaperone [Algoriphagus formosus]|uniref:iron chaperone n=1 Tax=Algoriphagus formosus TaxID=2007308 RepID=UPI000C2820A1|nr:DUF1801 domain-containing protein [Algoriphagus formosus]